MPDFYDVSDWPEKPHFQTGGTRNKSIVENPKNAQFYYFKTSLKKVDRDYKYEFWSEIIASEIGKLLGFNILEYHIAIKDNEIGCLSPSMVDTNINILSEGVNYLRGYDNNYDPNDRGMYARYTFQFIKDALKSYGYKSIIEDIIKTIIFDSLIGNGDRHQENWGIITSLPHDVGKKHSKSLSSKLRSISLRLKKASKKLDIEANCEKLRQTFIYTEKGKYAPIYDSGSCLGRELSENEVEELLINENKLNRYVNKSPCEIRWEDGKKKSHFELIKKMREESALKQFIDEEINRVSKAFSNIKIDKIVWEIDKNLPPEYSQHKLPDKRKYLIIKFITLRVDKLRKMIE